MLHSTLGLARSLTLILYSLVWCTNSVGAASLVTCAAAVRVRPGRDLRSFTTGFGRKYAFSLLALNPSAARAAYNALSYTVLVGLQDMSYEGEP